MKTLLEKYNQILQSISTALEDYFSKKKAGRPPKLGDLQILALFTLSYRTLTPVLTLAKILIEPSIQSYHIFRKSRMKLVLKLIKLKLIVDGTILELAKLSRV